MTSENNILKICQKGWGEEPAHSSDHPDREKRYSVIISTREEMAEITGKVTLSHGACRECMKKMLTK